MKNTRGLAELRQYVLEVLGGPDPWATGKVNSAGNLYTVGAYDLPVPVRARRGDDVLQDEDEEAVKDAQDEQRAACCLVIRPDGRVLSVSRKDDPDALGLPGGHVEVGEDPVDAAARELEEETGLRAVSLHSVHTAKDAQGFVTTTFACHVEGELGSREAGRIRWVRPEQLADPASSPFASYNAELLRSVGLLR